MALARPRPVQNAHLDLHDLLHNLLDRLLHDLLGTLHLRGRGRRWGLLKRVVGRRMGPEHQARGRHMSASWVVLGALHACVGAFGV